MASIDPARTARLVEIDRRAAALLKGLRLQRGKSPEALSHAIHGAGLGYVSGRTIRRIERYGTVPTARVQFMLAAYFGRSPLQVWTPRGVSRSLVIELEREVVA